MKRRLLSWVLVIVMVGTMLPVNALASMPEAAVEQPMTETITYINPLYADVLTEDDLVRPSDEAAVDTNAVSESEYATTFAEAGAQIREGMTQRQETVVAYYQTDTYDSSNHKDIFNAAVAHTGAPKEGDSLRWVYGGYNVSISRYSMDGVYYVTFIYTMTYYTTADQEAEMDDAVETLLTELALSGTDYEKLCTVYDYICDNITYDYDNLEDTSYKLKYTAYAALINKTSVCQGYAALLYRLVLEMGIDCRMITGIGNGGGHAWNIVKLNDVYYNADATWDASWLQGVGYYGYYLQCEDTFTEGGTDHFRDAEYDTAEFHAAYPISETDFDPAVDNIGDIASGICGENVTWTLSADGVLTISGSGAMTDLESSASSQPWYAYRSDITSIVVEGTVSHVGDQSFRWMQNVTSITLEEGVVTVGDYAMGSCTALTTIALPESLTTLGTGALGNTGLAQVVLPDGITQMGTAVLDGSQVQRVVLPANLTEIPARTFAICENLTEVIIPDSVTKIGEYAFAYCKTLPEITFPAGVTEIGEYALRECTALETVRFQGDAPAIADTAFWYDTVRAYYPEGNTTWTSDVMLDYGGDLLWGIEGKIIILASGICGENITWTLDEFYHLEITGTGDMYDWEASQAPWDDYNQNICSVSISDGITSIGSYAFFHNYDLASVELPDSVTTIGQEAFFYCSSLTKVDLPDQLVHIGLAAFGSTDLTGIEFPATLVTIGQSAFEGCSLTAAQLPEGVTSVGAKAFMGCPLTQLYIPASVTEIGLKAFENCAPLDFIQVDGENPVYCNDSQGALYNTDRSTLIAVPGGFSDQFVIPESVSRIEHYAFSNCDNLTAVMIPNTVTEMGDSVFWNCDGLTQLTFPDSMTVIPAAFASCCNNLTHVTIPETVTEIRDMAFFDTGLTAIDLPDGLTAMGHSVFQSCEALTTIEIPAGITVLPEGTLMGCTALTEVVLPDTMTALEPHCFNGCTALTEIDLPDGLTFIGSCAFYDCTALTSIDIPSGVTAIADNAFNNCNSMTEVNLPAELLSLDHHAFYGCDNLQLISIPDAVTAIPDYTFAFCPALTEIELPAALETLGLRAFWSCKSLKNITIPAGVSSIGDYCFSMSGLGEITFTGSAPVFKGSYVFQNVTVAAYYPAQDAAWTEDVMLDYGGTLTWIPYGEASLTITAQPVDYVGMVGDMASFTVAAEGDNLTYQWYFSKDNGSTWEKSGGTANTLTIEFKAYRNNYLYYCVVSDSEGNTATTNTVKLTAMDVELSIIAQPENYVGAVNDSVTFALGATGNGLTYQWYFSTDDGATWSKSYSPGYATNTLAPILRAHRDGNMYKCVITDVFGRSVESNDVVMEVQSSQIVILAQPQSVENGVLGQLYQLSVIAEGENLTYRWQYSDDGGETWQVSWNQGYNSATLNVRLNANRDGNLYRCVVTSGLKEVCVTEYAVLNLQMPSAEILSQSGNIHVLAGETATFRVEAEGMNLSYIWYRSNDKGATWSQTFLSGYNTDTLSFAANSGRAAMYMCKVIDGSGKVVWSDPVSLTILSAELKILTQPVSVTCAAGETATFTVEAQGDTLKYQWYASSDNGATWTASYLTGYNTNAFSFAVNTARAAKLYKCIITDVAGNTVETDAVTVTIG